MPRALKSTPRKPFVRAPGVPLWFLVPIPARRPVPVNKGHSTSTGKFMVATKNKSIASNNLHNSPPPLSSCPGEVICRSHGGKFAPTAQLHCCGALAFLNCFRQHCALANCDGHFLSCLHCPAQPFPFWQGAIRRANADPKNRPRRLIADDQIGWQSAQLLEVRSATPGKPQEKGQMALIVHICLTA